MYFNRNSLKSKEKKRQYLGLDSSLIRKPDIIPKEAAQCGKVAYTRKGKGMKVCWTCGNYHVE